MSEIVYEASVFTTKVAYRNFKGETNEAELYFALDPLKLMQIIAETPVGRGKSKNPALQGRNRTAADVDEFTDAQQLQFIRDLAIKAAGTPSEDGESWYSTYAFDETLAGKAFLTKLTSSDAQRQEFAQRVILDPFRAFVDFARSDESNNKSDIQSFVSVLEKLESVFAPGARASSETLEERKTRLMAELSAMESTDE